MMLVSGESLSDVSGCPSLQNRSCGLGILGFASRESDELYTHINMCLLKRDRTAQFWGVIVRNRWQLRLQELGGQCMSQLF